MGGRSAGAYLAPRAGALRFGAIGDLFGRPGRHPANAWARCVGYSSYRHTVSPGFPHHPAHYFTGRAGCIHCGWNCSGPAGDPGSDIGSFPAIRLTNLSTNLPRLIQRFKPQFLPGSLSITGIGCIHPEPGRGRHPGGDLVPGHQQCAPALPQ
jgi:hypothetical protein